MRDDNSKRIAVVTGANRGIGEEIARELSARGVHVIGTSRTPEGESLFPLDVTNPESIRKLVERVNEEGGADILVNNAGASFKGFDASVAERTLDVNFFGPLRLTDAMLPHLRDAASVVMVSSGMGTLSHVTAEVRETLQDPELTREALVALVHSFVTDVAAGTHNRRGWPSNAYSASKVSLNALVQVLARELANDRRNLIVNAVDPGWVRTRMGGATAPRSVAEGARTPVWLALLPQDPQSQNRPPPTGRFFRDQSPTPW